MNLQTVDCEYLVLLGQSGCGKSTTLRLIAGLETPDRGKIWIDGKNVTKQIARHRDVSMVFQNDGLYPHMTVKRNLCFANRQTLDRRTLDRRIEETAKRLGIVHLLERRVDRLSGGELRRVAVAKSVVRQASVRLLDEPLSAIDVSSRHTLQHVLRRWHEESPGLTIHVTHDGQEAMRMADRIAIMDRGQITQIDTPENIYNHPNSIAAARSVGVPPINLVKGRLEQDHLCLQLGADCNRIVPHSQKQPPTESRSVMIGIRPESITVGVLPKSSVPASTGEASGEIVLCGKCTWVKHYQGQRHAQVQVGSVFLETLSTGEARFNVGDEVQLSIDVVSFHLFDAVEEVLEVEAYK
ncbi:ABC transporter ATP-binding protein [Novipirellula aureliae]|uniref:ABC transporter ATP-binding protein n=1 Tax=Novipirellula aureliae TaxID=2527966 RepID=UPI001E2D610F|nr:ABC transporter ATP-binding protein [Novipirellula aureliae]